jgi:hypothetical protein
MPHGPDFIPASDTDFNTFATQFAAGTGDNLDALGLTAQDHADIQAAQAAFAGAYQACVLAQAQLHALTEAKNKARASSEKVFRNKVKKINAQPSVDNALRAKAGIPAHDTTKTVIHAPTTRPLVRLEATGHFTFTLHLADETTPTLKKKPQGATSCEIRCFVGDNPPADPGAYPTFANVTKATYVDAHPPEDAGKTAHYGCRWWNAKSEKGPWSDIASAKVPV